MKKDNIIGILIEKYKIQLILFFSILISKMLINLLFKGPTALMEPQMNLVLFQELHFLGEMIGQMLHLI